jgi:hypothetical protein
MNAVIQDIVVLVRFVKTLLDLICVNARKVSLEMEHPVQVREVVVPSHPRI